MGNKITIREKFKQFKYLRKISNRSSFRNKSIKIRQRHINSLIRIIINRTRHLLIRTNKLIESINT